MEIESYDFFTMGINTVKGQLEDWRTKADKIEEEYGPDARMEFEAGIASLVPSYAIFETIDQEVETSRKL